MKTDPAKFESKTPVSVSKERLELLKSLWKDWPQSKPKNEKAICYRLKQLEVNL